MNEARFHSITGKYPFLRVAVAGDFCLDRYLEIDPAKSETSIETGLPVHNVANVRSQPGGAGTILNNLVALGVGEIYPIGFAGEDGEGYELRRALEPKPGVRLDYFFQTPLRRTFTYTKPLVIEANQPPVELNRLDFKNWSPSPELVQKRIANSLFNLADKIDAIILLDQVSIPETGVVTTNVLAAINGIIKLRPGLLIIGDSRRSLKNFPPISFKMNDAELAALTGANAGLSWDEIRAQALTLSRQQGRPVFVTLAERGILGAAPSGEIQHLPALPLRGEIDVVGAGDAVTANLTASLAGGASLRESLEMAVLASSLVIHQLGTTGTATVRQINELLHDSPLLEA
ncbi:MAG: carbohydrate kinase [Chloroflexi bacterium]|nr:carbohydrate kinase [Chloroflexota bacterium]